MIFLLILVKNQTIRRSARIPTSIEKKKKKEEEKQKYDKTQEEKRRKKKKRGRISKLISVTDQLNTVKKLYYDKVPEVHMSTDSNRSSKVKPVSFMINFCNF